MTINEDSHAWDDRLAEAKAARELAELKLRETEAMRRSFEAVARSFEAVERAFSKAAEPSNE